LPTLEEDASHERGLPADVGTGVDREQRPDHEERPVAHVGDAGGDRAPTRRATRARQDIPPALRRAVLRRDERRCRVAGCRNATFLDLHHIRPRSEGGSHSADNLVTLCASHHRALHRGELRSAGDASDFRVLPGELGVPVRDGAPLPPSAPVPASSSLDVPAKVASEQRRRSAALLGCAPAHVLRAPDGAIRTATGAPGTPDATGAVDAGARGFRASPCR
jgi:hypothetical protein